MDNTTNGQNPNQPQGQQPVPSQTPVVDNASPMQPGVGNPPPLQNPAPVSPEPTQPTTKITLDDLYGPSGFADTASSPLTTPVTSSPQTVAPTANFQQPIPTPPNPVSLVPAPNEMQPPVPQPQMPPVESANIPDLPTVDSSTPTESTQQSDLPLRKARLDTEPEKKPEEPMPQTTLPPKPPENKKPSKGINKLSIFRILFIFLGVVVGLVVLLFVVTGISGLFHPSSSGKVTLTYWGLWEDSNTMQSVISEFEREHPNITVNYEKEDPKQYSQRLLTRIQQGNGPDIFTYHSSWLPMVQSSLVPLPTSVISKNDLQNNFYPVVGRDLVTNGALYGIPLGVDTLSLFVNNSLLNAAKAQVPTSWDTFTSTARALTQKDANGKIKVAGAAMGTFDNITHAPDIISMLFAQNGVDIPTLSPKGNASDALSFYTSFATGDSNVWDSTLDPSQLAFAKGNLAMYFGYSWDIFAIKAINPTLDFSVYTVPHLPGRNTTAASYWVEGVSVKSLHQQEALFFMQFLAQKNTESMLYAEEAKTRLFGEPYARSDLGSTLKDNKLVYPFVEQATDAQSSFFAGETQDSGLNGQMNGYLGNAVRSILNNTSADTAIDTLLQGVQQVESQYGSK